MRSISLRKSILTSTTFWSIILLLCQAIGPSVDRILTRGTFTGLDVWTIFQVCVTALVGVIARYNIGDVHTPKGVPGIDPPTRREVQEDVRRNDISNAYSREDMPNADVSSLDRSRYLIPPPNNSMR